MPATFIVTPELVPNLGYLNGQPLDATELLQQCSEEDHAKYECMLQSSFSDAYLSKYNVQASHNGFVWAAIEACSEHRNLVIRPDDVWHAIMTQFSIYVKANPQELRGQIMTRVGQSELEIVHDGPLGTYDWTKFSQELVSRFEQIIPDPQFQQWILPNFSTTEASDTVVSSVVMMSTFQHQLRYKLAPGCGIRAVTLLGERSDWEEIQNRIKMLSLFTTETHDWYELLRPVIYWITDTFRAPNKQFWQKIARQVSSTSQVDYVDGWITAFCFWGERGRRLQGKHRPRGLHMDAIDFSWVEIGDIAPGFASVPVELNENGHVHKARMIGGSMAVKCYNNHSDWAFEKAWYNTVQPAVGWCVFKTKG